MVFMKKQTVKKPKPISIKDVKKAKAVKVKLSKSDPDYYKKIGAISAARRKLKPGYFSEMAKLSHNSESRPDGYKGGRKKKTDNA